MSDISTNFHRISLVAVVDLQYFFQKKLWNKFSCQCSYHSMSDEKCILTINGLGVVASATTIS